MAGSFSLDIAKFAKQFGENANAAARKIALDIQRDLMLATPVDTGLLRSSWFIGVGSEPTDRPTKPGGNPEGQALKALASFKWGDTIYITNNQVYAWAIEYGHSKQMPSGMVRVTAARYQAKFGRW